MKKFCFLALNAAVFFSSLPAKAADSYLQDEIDQIKSDIVVIQRQLYREKSDTTAPKESVSNFQVRLGEYDQMIRDMNGKVENVEYRLKTLEKKLETFDKDILNTEEKPQSIVTRNLKVVKRIVSEGYGHMLKRTCVDQYKKKCFIFYANDRIAEIKNEEDAISRAKYEEKHTSSRKEMADTRMSELIKKAMEVR